MSPKSTTTSPSPTRVKSIVVKASGFAIGDYFYSEEFRNAIAERVYNSKKITVSRNDVVDELQIIFDMIDYVNSRKENVNIILNRTLDDFVVPEEFKAFIRPNSVRYDSGDRRCLNLLPDVEFNDEDAPTYNAYLNAIARYRGFYKKASNDGLVTLSSLRIDRSFEEVRSIMSVELDDTGMVHYDGTPFIPLRLTTDGGFFAPYYWDTSDREVLNDWIILLNND